MLVPGPQVAAVVRGGEAADGDPHDSGQGPVPQVVLTWRISAESAVLPGQHQTRTRDAVAGGGHPDHDPERRRLVLGRLLRVMSDVAVLVPGHRLVLAVQLEVGAGGAGEQQVYLEQVTVTGHVRTWAEHTHCSPPR